MSRLVWILGLFAIALAAVVAIDPLPLKASGFIPTGAPLGWWDAASALQSVILALPLFCLLCGLTTMIAVSRAGSLARTLEDLREANHPLAPEKVTDAFDHARMLSEEARRFAFHLNRREDRGAVHWYMSEASSDIFDAHEVADAMIQPWALQFASLAAASAGVLAACLTVAQVPGADLGPAGLFLALGLGAGLLAAAISLPQREAGRRAARHLIRTINTLFPPLPERSDQDVTDAMRALERAFRNFTLRFDTRLGELPGQIAASMDGALAPQVQAFREASDALCADHAKLARDIARTAAEGASGTVGAAVAEDVRAVATSLAAALQAAAKMEGKLVNATEALDKALTNQTKLLKTAITGAVKGLKGTVQDGLTAQDKNMAAAVASFSKTVTSMQSAAQQVEAAGNTLAAMIGQAEKHQTAIASLVTAERVSAETIAHSAKDLLAAAEEGRRTADNLALLADRLRRPGADLGRFNEPDLVASEAPAPAPATAKGRLSRAISALESAIEPAPKG